MNPPTVPAYLLSDSYPSIYHLLSDLTADDLRYILTKLLRNSSTTHNLSNWTHRQLFQECLTLLVSCNTPEVEETLRAVTQNSRRPDNRAQQPRAEIPPGSRQSLPMSNPQRLMQHHDPPNFQLTPPTIHVGPSRLKIVPLSSANSHTSHQLQNNPQPLFQQTQPNILINSILTSPSQRRSSSATTLPSNNTPTPTSSHNRNPVLPSSLLVQKPSGSNVSTTTNSQLPATKMLCFKKLLFYKMIACVYERANIFRYDSYRKHYLACDEFILSFEHCNLLSLSYNYDLNLKTTKTSKSLILRLARIDQPAAPNGMYEDEIPPNLFILINGQSVANLPQPKPCTRQQTDLIRNGREINITQYIMFNPILRNEIKMTWSVRQDNIGLCTKYQNATFSMHIYLADNVTVDELLEKIMKKPARFLRQDSAQLIADACARDRENGVEVSDQILKITCPIDHRHIKLPGRATTCQHLQCFDLKNYIAMNEKSDKWICPICNKAADFRDLQIDSYMEAIMYSIQDKSITEITIDPNLNWKPVKPLVTDPISNSNPCSSSEHSPICLDDDDDDD